MAVDFYGLAVHYAYVEVYGFSHAWGLSFHKIFSICFFLIQRTREAPMLLVGR